MAFKRKNFYSIPVFGYRAVTDSINELLNVCSSSAPGQKECENALRKVEVCAVF